MYGIIFNAHTTSLKTTVLWEEGINVAVYRGDPQRKIPPKSWGTASFNSRI